MTAEHVDVVIVGAGLSGIGAGRHLQTLCPDKRFVILEARDAIGGTWDLFRYPGVRSDSDMHTLGYAFRPWRAAKAIADGPSILSYVRDTAQESGVEERVRLAHRVRRARWSSAEALWTVEAEIGPERTACEFTCGFLLMCSGYYDYAKGHDPFIPGFEDFQGAIVHPQHWPDDLDYAEKRVVVIGSGATAMTLVPEMSKTASSVVMVQRSPTYVVSRPSEDALANRLNRRLPAKLAYGLVRWRNVLLSMVFFNLARKRPEKTKRQLVDLVRGELGPDYDVETHFTPRYNPWDQRICLVPDADLFKAIRSGRASVVTDQIDRFTRTGLRLASGRELEADVVVKATGLKLQLLGGMDLQVDGRRIDLSRCMTYKGMMFSDVPNLASVSGYTNASWTLKADLISKFVCRLIRYMDRRSLVRCTARRRGDVGEQPWLDFSSGYVLRSLAELPKQGSKAPWKLHQNYALDLFNLSFSRLDDGVLEFAGRSEAAASSPAPRQALAAE